MALILSFCALAHPGRTDSKGGHTDSSTGEYHYHHGYSAHQHTNGVCPYDFKDKTGSNSGSSEDKGMTLEKWHAIINPKPTPAPTKKPLRNIGGLILPIVLIGPAALFTALLIVRQLIKGFLNFVAWVICQLADSIDEDMICSEKTERRKDIRRRRFILYTFPCGFVFMALALLAQDQDSKVTNIWVPIGVAITIGICWGIERLLALLFHLLAEWARKYRGEDN
jgi:hypothetical protein